MNVDGRGSDKVLATFAAGVTSADGSWAATAGAVDIDGAILGTFQGCVNRLHATAETRRR